jgi:hypothetical protein
MGRGGYLAELYLACWIFLPFTEVTIDSLVEPSRSSEMSPLQVMVCYMNNPAVVLSIFVTARAAFSQLLEHCQKSLLSAVS